MTTATDTADTTATAARLDFDQHAAGFSRALAHLDRAATKELDQAASTRSCAS